MEKDLMKVFDYEGAEVRTVVKDEEIWFVAKDVCDILGHTNTTMALKALDEDERTKVSLGRQGEANIINESGLYNLIFASKLKGAKKFKKWVTSEVLPTIRKYGVYGTPQTIEQMIANPDFAIQLLQSLKAEREEKQQLKEQLRIAQPKANKYDQFLDAEGLMTGDVVAKILGTGRNKMYKLLREEGIYKSDNVPYQQYVDRGYFKVKSKVTHIGVVNVTLITPKGANYIASLINKKNKVS